jgi:hypothetical protein
MRGAARRRTPRPDQACLVKDVLLCGGLLSVSTAIGTVNLHEFVVDAKDEERRCPLADEEGHVISLRNLEGDRDSHRGQRRTEVNARWNLYCDFSMAAVT